MSCTNLVGENLRESGTQENRPHAGIGYVTPDDEHHGRGEALRQARRDGMTVARQTRIAYRRSTSKDQP